MTAPVLIPHPLCTNSPKELEAFYATRKEDRQSITDYIVHSGNPKWAASHLIRAVANGLVKAHPDASALLGEVANHLAACEGREPPLPENTLTDEDDG